MQLDAITIARIELLHPVLRSEARRIYEEICAALTSHVFCRFTFTLRTIAEQNELYAQGRTKPGKRVTNAKGGQSYHNYGLAVDVALINGKGIEWSMTADHDKDGLADWREVVAIFKKYGWEWGGDWKMRDNPHFQKTLGYSIAQLQTIMKAQPKGTVYPPLK